MNDLPFILAIAAAIAILLLFLYLLGGIPVVTTVGKVVSISNTSFIVNQWNVQYAYTGREALTTGWWYNNGYSDAYLESIPGKNCTIVVQWYALKQLNCV